MLRSHSSICYIFFALVGLLSGCSRGVATSTSSCPLDREYTKGTYFTEIAGESYTITDGTITKTSDGSYIGVLYSPTFFSDNFRFDGCNLSQKIDSTYYSVIRSFAASFEPATHLRSLIGLEHLFTGFVLQSPLAPTVSDYVTLRNCILGSTCTFLDSQIAPNTSLSTVGSQSLRFTAVPKSGGMVTSKASIESNLPFFVEGDDVWFQADYYIEAGMPFTLFDIESTYLDLSPGPRLRIDGDQALDIELKWGDKPVYSQVPGSKLVFPSGQWVRVKVHFLLKSDLTGVIQVWQNGTQVIDTTGQTLPLPNTILNGFEIGITSFDNASPTAVMSMDNVYLSTVAP